MIIKFIETTLFITSTVFLFFNWKVAVVLFLIGFIIHIISGGPNFLLSNLTGLSLIVGFVFLFFSWQTSIFLFFIAYVLTKFRIYGNKTNDEYYSKNINPIVKEAWEEFKKLEVDVFDKESIVKMIDEFMIPDNISVEKFVANFQIISYGSRETYKTYTKVLNEPDYSQVGTPSIDTFSFIGNRPLGYENWFIAAYPDVVSWLKDLEDEEINNLLGNMDELNEKDFLNNNYKFKFDYLRKIINVFKTIKNKLECT